MTVVDHVDEASVGEHLGLRRKISAIGQGHPERRRLTDVERHGHHTVVQTPVFADERHPTIAPRRDRIGARNTTWRGIDSDLRRPMR